MKTIEKLTDLAVKSAKPTIKVQKFADGAGLYLQVTPSGGKYWRYKYRFAGKHQEIALGVYPEVPLKQARQAHKEARMKLAEGINPSEARRIEKLTRLQAASNCFGAISQEWINTRLKDKSLGHRSRAESLLLKDLALLADRPIAEIKAPELLAALRRIESRGVNDTAHRARQTAQHVFSYAISTGRAERNPAADLKGTLEPRQTFHRAAITDPQQLGKLLRDIEASSAGVIVKTAMRLSPMLFQRPGEIRAMEWSEINWKEAIWEIGAGKMKMRHDHIVPLPTQALTLLKDIQAFTGKGRYVFPSARGGSRCLSENGVRTALRDLGYGNDVVTPHGFRATARTILDEVLNFRVDIIEHQLAHAVKDANGRAYNRTSHLPQRVEMMQAWADYLDQLKQDVH